MLHRWLQPANERDAAEVLSGPVGINYILELTNGVTWRIVEVLRLTAKTAIRKDSRVVSMDDLQEAGKEFASDLGSERNVSH